MGWSGRKNEKKASPLEKTIFVKGRENYPHEEHFGQYTYLSIVSLSNAQASCKKARKITKGFSLGRGKLGKKNPLNQLGGGVHPKGERGSRHSED